VSTGACLSNSCKIPYWNAQVEPDAVALWWNGDPYLTYSVFCERVTTWANTFSAQDKSTILFYVSNTPDAIPALTGMLAAGHAILLADPNLTEPARRRIENQYEPHWIVSLTDGNVEAQRTQNAPYEVHPDLALLLSTSGSTGSPKFVRLSHDNIQHNARAIAKVLHVSSSDVAAAHLDFHYSYGLSVLTSHLVSGAACFLSAGKFTDREFWHSMKSAPVTHLPGVPANYQIMQRLQFKRLTMPHLTTMTQAGGRLTDSVRDAAHAYMESVNGKFYVMYGQTEASPRMTTLAHENYRTKRGSVGLPLPDGSIVALDDNNEPVPAGHTGQIVYQGPNVMMGYASGHRDLAAGDELNGVLHTGDTGSVDEEGYLTITGRHSRMGKVFGWRVSLDEVESLLEQCGPCAVMQIDDQLAVVTAPGNPASSQRLEHQMLALLESNFPLPITVYRFYEIAEIPLNARNKTDYMALREQLVESVEGGE